MHGTRVPFYACIRQIPLTIIAFCSCGLSFWLTLRFCADLAPGHAAMELLAIGLTWELAKLVFGNVGTQRIKSGLRAHRASGYALWAVSLVLAAGSIMASRAFLLQADAKTSRDALDASQAYQRASTEYDDLTHLIATQSALAAGDAHGAFRTRGQQKVDRVEKLLAKRDAAARAMATQEAQPGARAEAGVSPATQIAKGRCAAQWGLAVMIELVGMVAIGLLTQRQPSMAAGAAKSPPPRILPDAARAPRPGCVRTGTTTSAVDYARAKSMVVSAQLKPSYRAMQRALGVSQPRALQLLRDMAADGILQRVGRCYALAQDVLTQGTVAGGAT